jgi:DNA helicase HerA-like ATPase
LSINLPQNVKGFGSQLFVRLAAKKAGTFHICGKAATGTGKTRTAAALLKRLFEANWATRALFVVDRNPLAIQTEDAFAEQADRANLPLGLPQYLAHEARAI